MEMEASEILAWCGGLACLVLSIGAAIGIARGATARTDVDAGGE